MTIEVPFRRGIANRLRAARRITDDLFALVRDEALYERPIAERHRIVFYIGHLEAFDANLIRSTLGDVRSADASLDKLFAFGIDPLGEDLPSDTPTDWPNPTIMRDYIDATRSAVDSRLHRGVDGLAEAGLIFNVAIEHRLMHAETLAYMMHRLPFSAKAAGVREPDLPATPPHRAPLAIPAGSATLGQTNGFGWDNEFPASTVVVPAFSIDACKVTNAEFADFIRAGGYSDRELWSPANWAWLAEHRIRHPAFWVERGGDWFWRGMFAERALPPDWPVYVSHAEASAYARWRGGALPSEAQFHRAAYASPDGTEQAYPWGDGPPASAHGNFDFQRWDPEPVTAHPAGRSAFGVDGLLGNGWEWTATVFAPFDGFAAFSFYPGYSADFFDGSHFVIKGGSMRTASPLLRRSFRNWFQGRYPYVYAGFRCVYGPS
ncbi:MAG: SUMF1/EgtB/PvdO family nonheme iron enzyme [Bauldia sp.]